MPLTRSPLPCSKKQCVSFQASVNSDWRYCPEMFKFEPNLKFFDPCNLEIWQMTLESNRVPFLCHFKLCVSFHSHLDYEFKLELWYGNTQIGQNLFWLLWPWPSTSDFFCMDITFVNGNDSWKFYDDIMRRTLWKRSDRQIDRPTDRRTRSFIELLGCLQWAPHINKQNKIKRFYECIRNFNSSGMQALNFLKTCIMSWFATLLDRTW